MADRGYLEPYSQLPEKQQIYSNEIFSYHIIYHTQFVFWCVYTLETTFAARKNSESLVPLIGVRTSGNKQGSSTRAYVLQKSTCPWPDQPSARRHTHCPRSRCSTGTKRLESHWKGYSQTEIRALIRDPNTTGYVQEPVLAQQDSGT